MSLVVAAIVVTFAAVGCTAGPGEAPTAPPAETPAATREPAPLSGDVHLEQAGARIFAIAGDSLYDPSGGSADRVGGLPDLAPIRSNLIVNGNDRLLMATSSGFTIALFASDDHGSTWSNASAVAVDNEVFRSKDGTAWESTKVPVGSSDWTAAPIVDVAGTGAYFP